MHPYGNVPTAQRRVAGLCLARFALAACVALLGTAVRAQPRITETDSIPVARIRFEGNTAFDDGRLQDLIATREHPWALPLFLYHISERLPFAAPPQYFDYPTLQEDVETLTQFYRNNGFRDARVEGKYDVAKDSSRVDVLFSIEEGTASLVDSVGWHPIERFAEPLAREIREGTLVKVGRRYDAAAVSSENDRILELLRNAGYPLAKTVEIVVGRKLSDRNVVVDFTFDPGRLLYFGPIRDTVRERPLNLAHKIITERLEYAPDTLYSEARKAQSEVNLARLGIFSSVQIRSEFPPAGSADSTVPTTVILTPRDKHELGPGVIVRYDRLGRFNSGAFISYITRNIFGGAANLNTKVEVLGVIPSILQSFQATASVQFEQPYLFDNATSGTWSIAYILAHETGSYGGGIFQNVLGMKRIFGPHVTGTADWTLEESNYTEIENLASSPFAPFDTTGINYRNSILTLTLENDRTNDFFNPTAGLSLRGTVEEAGILRNAFPGMFAHHQSIEYFKTEGLLRYFTDLSRNATSIFGFKLRLGGIFRYGQSARDDIPVPFNRRYYAGGASSVRGWGANRLHHSGREELARFGSNALVESSVELRWQLFPGAPKWTVVEPDKFWLVFFTDAGNLWDSPATVRLSETAVAFGFGLRYNIFIGPLRIDYGMRAFDPPAERPWFTEKKFWREVFLKGVFQFGIGHAF